MLRSCVQDGKILLKSALSIRAFQYGDTRGCAKVKLVSDFLKFS